MGSFSDKNAYNNWFALFLSSVETVAIQEDRTQDETLYRGSDRSTCFVGHVR